MLDIGSATNRIVIGVNASGTADNTLTVGGATTNKITSWLPGSDIETNLGSSNKQFNDLYMAGRIYINGGSGQANQYLGRASTGETEWMGLPGIPTVLGELDDCSGSDTAQSYGVGQDALAKNTGSNNTAMGFQALQDNTTGSGNTAFGCKALQKNTTATLNTAVG